MGDSDRSADAVG